MQKRVTKDAWFRNMGHKEEQKEIRIENHIDNHLQDKDAYEMIDVLTKIHTYYQIMTHLMVPSEHVFRLWPRTKVPPKKVQRHICTCTSHCQGNF